VSWSPKRRPAEHAAASTPMPSVDLVDDLESGGFALYRIDERQHD
jgi:hypothetical protein